MASYKEKGKKHIGRLWRGKCYFPYQKKERVAGAEGVEYMVLTQDWGLPMATKPTDKPQNYDVVLNARARNVSRQRICSFTFERKNKGVSLELPGLMLPGKVCLSAAKGKTRAKAARKVLSLR